jgi:hypothetical protein
VFERAFLLLADLYQEQLGELTRSTRPFGMTELEFISAASSSPTATCTPGAGR